MTKPKHLIRAPGTYFITAQSWQRRSLFAEPAAAAILVEQMLHYRGQGAYLLHHFVVMPDHFHLLLTPSYDITLEKAVQLIKGSSSYRIRRELNHRIPVWQIGFYDHRIRDAADWHKHVRYIVRNPVNAKLAEDGANYRFSSASGLYPLDPLPQGLKPTRVGRVFVRAEART